ncbi:protein translocase SEC61 complex subunit gamma [Candidatus Micrarchaeota archaeon]|nr:protein translocase SEC61 complex subunit gamma [Candidatus Micrarchaeota archaeon]
MDVFGGLRNFILQSQRVLIVTHKPSQYEFRHIASSTALGMIVIGAIGFAITLIVSVLR